MASHGYPADALSTLRRVHETFVKACDTAWVRPAKKLWAIVRDGDLRKSEKRLGLDLTAMQRVHGGFVHGNFMHYTQAAIALEKGESPKVRYGPRHDTELGHYLAAVSIFWLYVGVKVAPVLFPGSAKQPWLTLQTDSAAFLRGYLSDRKTGLLEDCDAVDAMVAARIKAEAESAGSPGQVLAT
jgi:hypothetical protein